METKQYAAIKKSFGANTVQMNRWDCIRRHTTAERVVTVVRKPNEKPTTQCFICNLRDSFPDNHSLSPTFSKYLKYRDRCQNSGPVYV